MIFFISFLHFLKEWAYRQAEKRTIEGTGKGQGEEERGRILKQEKSV